MKMNVIVNWYFTMFFIHIGWRLAVVEIYKFQLTYVVLNIHIAYLVRPVHVVFKIPVLEFIKKLIKLESIKLWLFQTTLTRPVNNSVSWPNSLEIFP